MPWGRDRSHTHPCWTCGAKMECGGELIRNHDGVPEVICVIFHEDHYGRMACEACEASRCEWCGSVLRVETHDEHCESRAASSAAVEARRA